MTKGLIFVLGLGIGGIGAFIAMLVNLSVVGDNIELAWCRLGDTEICEMVAHFASMVKCEETADHLNMMCDHTTATQWSCELDAGQRYTNKKYQCRMLGY